MSKISVNELRGAALDYAVALAEGIPRKELKLPGWKGDNLYRFLRDEEGKLNGHYMTGPDLIFHKGEAGDKIIDREKIATEWCWSLDEPCWQARIYQHSPTRAHAEDGATRREAAMRCYVASKLGAEVEIPKELA